jgi:hypothetical protein
LIAGPYFSTLQLGVNFPVTKINEVGNEAVMFSLFSDERWSAQ